MFIETRSQFVERLRDLSSANEKIRKSATRDLGALRIERPDLYRQWQTEIKEMREEQQQQQRKSKQRRV